MGGMSALVWFDELQCAGLGFMNRLKDCGFEGIVTLVAIALVMVLTTASWLML